MNRTDEVFELGMQSQVSCSDEQIAKLPTDVSTLVDSNLLQELEAVPQKMAFKIGEVGDIAGVKQYVLRYWETEFDVLRPKKSSHNQRMYSRKDVETVLLIKKLLYQDRFSISGARAVIKKLRQKVQPGSVERESFKHYTTTLEKARVLLAEIQRVQAALN